MAKKRKNKSKKQRKQANLERERRAIKPIVIEAKAIEVAPVDITPQDIKAEAELEVVLPISPSSDLVTLVPVVPPEAPAVAAARHNGGNGHGDSEEDQDAKPEHRASARMRLEVELHLSSDSHFFSGLSGDISEGGVFVSTYRRIARGSLVDVEFSLPGSQRLVHARGEVRWHRDASPDAPPGVGIAFEDVSPEDRHAIQRFCVSRPPLYYELD